ncbi:MAG: 30S ribosomal protein S16 [Candidatus Omnitrophica bacterium]|nr:30S ribosomal protein S16 [Candidatus Omnitrophota bacterium]
MAVRLRLMRMGAKNRPHSKIVATDSRSPRSGRFLEEIGIYDPSLKVPLLQVNRERVEYWLSVGAQPSDTVRSLLKKEGIKA